MKLRLHTIGFIGLVGIASLSLAQTEPVQPTQAPTQRYRHDPAAFVEKRLSTLKADLKITDQQGPAWEAFADTVKQQIPHMKAQHQALRKVDMTAPERLAQHTDFLKQRLAGMENTRTAFETLYDQLSPEQKAIADKRAFRLGKRHRI